MSSQYSSSNYNKIALPIDTNRNLLGFQSVMCSTYDFEPINLCEEPYIQMSPLEASSKELKSFAFEQAYFSTLSTTSKSDECFPVVISLDQSDEGSKEQSSRVITRDILTKEVRFDLKFKRLCKTTLAKKDSDEMLVTKSKKAAPRSNKPGKTRSKYIGVTKNKDQWQTLVTIGKRKSYVGGYKDETFAAVTFDFYSLVLHGYRAVTNFSYNKSMILELLSNYEQNNNKVVPSLLSFKHDLITFH